GLGFAADGSLYVCQAEGLVRRIDPAGIVRTVAGGGTLSGTAGDGLPATSAQLNFQGLGIVGTGLVADIAVEADGGFFVSERGASTIRHVDAQGVIQTVAGTGQQGPDGDGGDARQARLGSIVSLAIEPAGSLLVS